MIKLLKDKKGMTLIELVVAMCIFAILSTGVLAVLVPTLKAYDEVKKLAEISELAANIANEIENDLNSSTKEPLIPSVTPATDQTEITIFTGKNKVKYYLKKEDGMDFLWKKYDDESDDSKDSIVMNKKYYDNKSIKVSYEKDTGTLDTIYSVNITIFDENDRSLIDRKIKVRPPLLNQYN